MEFEGEPRGMREVRDAVREAKVRAISLRRSRRGKAAKTAGPQGLTSRLSGRLGALAAGLVAPPHQAVQALLGLSSLTIKQVGHTWETLVAEGADIEASIGNRLGNALRHVPLPFATAGKSDR